MKGRLFCCLCVLLSNSKDEGADWGSAQQHTQEKVVLALVLGRGGAQEDQRRQHNCSRGRPGSACHARCRVVGAGL